MSYAHILISKYINDDKTVVLGWETIEGVFSSKERAKAKWKRLLKDGEQRGAEVIEYFSRVHGCYVLSITEKSGCEKRYKIMTEEMNNA